MPRRKKHKHESHPDERWVLTYADMLTLLLGLFIVMYAISSINVSKAESLQKSMSEAFSGGVIQGGQTIKETGGSTQIEEMAVAPPKPSLQAAFAPTASGQASSVKEEQQSLKELEDMINAEGRRQGIALKIKTELRPDGLLVRLKTDGIFFDPGQATIKPQAAPLLRRIAQLLRADSRHAVMVTGHTDSQPISGTYPTNWELSTARASAVVRSLIASKVAPARLTATGRAFHDPVASNGTASGRAANRRVELFIPRMQARLSSSK